MRIFVSYPSERREAAEGIAFSLRGAGHTVFLDRDDLPPGRTYDDQIRAAIRRSDLVVFLMAPEAFEPNRYTLSELAFVRAKWPSPKGHVLPVLIAPLRHGDIPAYLASVTFLQPQGNVVAEVAHEIERLRKQRLVRSIVGGALSAVIGVGAVFGAAYYANTLTEADPIARFAVSGFGENVLEIGETELFAVVNETPEAARGYTCEIAVSNPNVASATATPNCSEVRVVMVDRPFAQADGALMPTQADGAQPFEISVSVRLLDARGNHVGELRESLRAVNALSRNLRVDGAPSRIRMGDTPEIRATYANADLPAAFSCRAESRHFEATEIGRCQFRLRPRPEAFTSQWLAQGNVQPAYVNIIVSDREGRVISEHMQEIEVGA